LYNFKKNTHFFLLWHVICFLRNTRKKQKIEQTRRYGLCQGETEPVRRVRDQQQEEVKVNVVVEKDSRETISRVEAAAGGKVVAEGKAAAEARAVREVKEINRKAVPIHNKHWPDSTNCLKCGI